MLQAVTEDDGNVYVMLDGKLLGFYEPELNRNTIITDILDDYNIKLGE